MSFTFPALFYASIIPLVALPILIHLINLLRHRRVKWAAMEFLLESKKKNQNWIRLKQLLLLLARMAAIAAIVFMMAGPVLRDQWSKLFGGGKTHHVVLLDDSGSMADRWLETNAFARARDVVQNIVLRASRETDQHSLTLLRFSDAAAGRQPEVMRAALDSDYEAKFDQLKDKLTATQLSVGPLEAIETIDKTVTPDEDEKLIVYIVSDLRRSEWQDASALKQALAGLTDRDAQIQLIHCVDEARGNLAITHMAPAPGQQAVGVLIRMEVEVTNFGTQDAHNVPVQLDQRTFRGPDDLEGEIGSLGAVKIDRIAAGAAERRSFDVVFNNAGSHEVTARLPSDALEADNQRFSVVEVAADVPVLIVDGGGIDDPLFLRLALSPSPRTKTGVKAELQTTQFLRDNDLASYHTIYLFNIDRLDPTEIANLETYVRDGGGVVFFCGDATQREFYNDELYREGEGLFPLAISAPTTLLVDRLEKAPDVSVDASHPVFRRYADKYGSWLQKIIVQRYYGAAKEWRADGDPNTSVIATVRNGDPLIVEKKFGKGCVHAMLMTAAPLWHNWGLNNPIFVVAALETQVYLGSFRTPASDQPVGAPLALQLPSEEYQSEVEFSVPKEVARQTLTSHAAADDENGAALTVTLDQTARSGIYEARLIRADGTAETRRYSFNVPSREGDLKIVGDGELRSLLGDVEFQYHQATDFLTPVRQLAGFPLGEQWWFFLALVVLLIVEQLLAYSASYHPPLTGGSR